MPIWGNLLTQIRARLQDQANYWDDAELFVYGASTQDRIAREARWYRKRATIIGVSGVNEYEVPPDCYEMLSAPKWDGIPLTKMPGFELARRLGKTYLTRTAARPGYFNRDSVGEDVLALFPIPDSGNSLVNTDDLDNTNDPVTFTVASGDGSKFEAGQILAVYDATAYPYPFDDPNLEYVTVSSISGDDLTVTRAANGSTAQGHPGTPTVAVIYDDALTFPYVAIPPAPTTPQSTIYLPRGGERAFVFGTVADCYLKEIDRQNLPLSNLFSDLYEAEMLKLKARTSEEFDTLPFLTTEIPRGIL